MWEVTGDKYMYVTYSAHLVGIKRSLLTATMHGVESFKIIKQSS
jgi:hypothetical protein